MKTTIRAAAFAALLLALGALSACHENPPASSAAPAPAPSGPPVFPLKVSANGRYVVDQNNVPFLMVGDTPQGLMGRLNEKDAEFYFADREAHGFNTSGWIDVMCAGNDYKTNTYATTPDGIRPFTGFVAGGTDYTHYDITKPNEPYFKRLDDIVQIAANHHQAVFLDPIETIGWLAALRNNGMKSAHWYGDYLGKRYARSANVMWISGNDFDNWTIPQDDDLVQEVAKAIRAAAPNQLQTVELHVRTSSSMDDPRWVPLIDLNGTYTYSPTYIQMLHSYNQKPVKPDYMQEAHYDLENVGTPPDFGTPNVLRREDYWLMLSGGVGQFYGNKYTWSFADGWQSKIDTPGVDQLKIWKEFFTSMPWQDLVPDQDHSVLTAGFGTYGDVDTRVSESDYATAARVSDGSFVVTYMPTVRTIAINMASLKGSARARWFDPSNGTYRSISGSPFANNGSQQFTPPGKNHDGDGDWVLLLDAQ
jgi:hypothetical protein